MTDRVPLPPARLGRALRRGFRAAYDNLGYVVAATMVVFVVTAGLVTAAGFAARVVPAAVGLLLAVVAILPAWLGMVGICYFAQKSVYEGHAAISDTWEGIGKLLGPAIALYVVDLLVSAVLFGDTVFFLAAFRAKGGVAFAALGVFGAYLSLMWMLMGLYHLPLLVAQLEMESGPRAMVILRKSFLMVADNPGFTLGFFVVIIAFACLCTLSGFGVVIAFAGTAAFLLTCALRELFVKYGVVEEEPELVEDKPWRLPGN